MTDRTFTAAQLRQRAIQLYAAAADSIGAKADSLRRDSSMLLQAAAAESQWEALKEWLAFVDFPTAWRIVNETTTDQHHEECSFRVGERGVLCDCVGIGAATVARKDVAAYMARLEKERTA